MQICRQRSQGRLDRKVEHRRLVYLGNRGRQTDRQRQILVICRQEWQQTVARQIGQSWAQDTNISLTSRVRLVCHDLSSISRGYRTIQRQANVRERRHLSLPVMVSRSVMHSVVSGGKHQRLALYHFISSQRYHLLTEVITDSRQKSTE